MKKFRITEILGRMNRSLEGKIPAAICLNFVYNILLTLAGALLELALTAVMMVFAMTDEKIMSSLAAFESMTEEELAALFSDMTLQKAFEQFGNLMIFFGIFIVVCAVAAYLYYIFAFEHINAGFANSFLRMREGNVSYRNLTTGFIRNYSNLAKVSALKWLYLGIAYIIPMLIMFVFMVLYALGDSVLSDRVVALMPLLMMVAMIPGIVLYYRYTMISYILSDNPHIQPGKALSISRILMKGNKFRLFLLQIPFGVVLWILMLFSILVTSLFALLPGGQLFMSIVLSIVVAVVFAFYNMAKTEVYCELKNQAVANGEIDPADLDGISIVTSGPECF